MLELAEKVISLTASKSKLVFRPLPPDDPSPASSLTFHWPALFWTGGDPPFLSRKACCTRSPIFGISGRVRPDGFAQQLR